RRFAEIHRTEQISLSPKLSQSFTEEHEPIFYKRSTACFASLTSRTASYATDFQSPLCAFYSALRRLGRHKHELPDLESGGHLQPNQDLGPVRRQCGSSGCRRVRLVGLDNAADNRSR
ncbi:MAG: hypothetical protein RR326_05265, partial [Stenotrophomonas sp.]